MKSQILLLLGGALYLMAGGYVFINGIKQKERNGLIICMVFLVLGLVCFLSAYANQETMEEKCIKNGVSYELVEASAKETLYSEEEVLSFLTIMSKNGVEPYDAVSMLSQDRADDIMRMSDEAQAKEDNND